MQLSHPGSGTNLGKGHALRAERLKEGILKAQQNGVAFGRKAKLAEEQASEMRQKRS